MDAKVAYFKQLKELCQDGDDHENNRKVDDFDAREEKRRRLHRNFFKPRQEKKGAPSLPRQQSLPVKKPQIIDATPRRVTSAPQPESAMIIKGTQSGAAKPKGRLGALLYYGSDIVQETPLAATARREGADTTPLPQSKKTIGSMSEDSPSLNMKKRKKSVELKMRPEEERIFRDLAFFYVPDNDIAPARRLRINKAKEFGATWTRNMTTATHVIVDKNLEYKDAEKVLPRAGNRARQPKVVNEDYPIDCIQFRAILDPNQKKYLLNGQTLVEAEEKLLEPPSSEESVTSLQLKPQHHNKKKWDHVPQRGTSSQSEEASHHGQVGGTITIDSQPIVLDLGQTVEAPKDAMPDGGSDSEQVLENNAVKTNPEGRATPKQDELSKYISMMQEFKDLPLDHDEDDAQSTMDQSDARSDFDGGSASESEQARKRRKPIRRTTRSSRKDIAFENKFACNRAGEKDAHADNPNTRTIEVLQSMLNYYERINDQWRMMAYRKAISTLKRQDVKITMEEEAFQLPSIGLRLAQKIEEIVTTNKLKRLEYAEGEPMDNSLEIFLGVYGVGNKLAEQWIAQGLRTLDDVKQKVKLTPSQLVGVGHYDDLNIKIPRREVAALGEVVKKTAARIDPGVQLIIGGSYRRGAESSGDIDFIITKPNTESSTDLRKFLDDLIHRLESDKFLVARLASPRGVGDGSKWHSCCVLPKIKGFNDKNYKPIWRRIDFLLVPESEMGAALIYFTGNDIFNRSMRLLARKKGMRLNQRGLYRDVLRGRDGNEMTEGELVEGRDERRIFETLGVKWREPHERWC
ncbi:DNA polymerase lambda [Cladobotryum mycophilum]|uniref:DNA polymerase lambda n=1 Tax=Cladobotryum mycophilum TaxID=491253 RepID=A0ABR0SF56_9HYPO